MALSNTWALNFAAKSLYRDSGTAFDSSLDLYSWVQDQMDELSALDDTVPMSAQTPTAFSLINGWTIPANDYKYLKGGSITDTTNDDLWTNVYTIGTIESGTQLYIEQDGDVLSPWWTTGHIDVLVKVKDTGSLIDSGLIRIFAREYTDINDHFQVDLSTGGRNPVPVATTDDSNNQTSSGTVATWTDVTVTFGTVSRNLNNGNGAKNYDVEIDCASRRLSQVYERLKYITRRGETTTLNGIQGQLYRSANAGYTDVKASAFGTYAGGTFFGARGVWLKNVNAADVKSFQLVAADGTVQTPPNVVAVAVNGLVSGDRLAVFRLDTPAGAIKKDEMVTAGTNSIGASTLNVDAIASDVPSVGYVRISIDANTEHLYTYTGWAGTQFTGVSPTLAQTYSTGINVYAPLLDKQAALSSESNSLIYAADIPVITRVRKKGILPFEVEGTVTAAGLTVTAIRTTDLVVT
jgi:hypothetical protein